jgi:hypothetical protein
VDSKSPVPVPSKTLGGEELLREEAARLLGPFKFHASQKREMFAAFKAHPDGVERCALRARAAGSRSGTTGAGLLLSMVRAGEHELEPDLTAQRPTGWRFVRGEGGAAGTYVEDEAGVDRLPAAYDFTTHNPVLTAPRPDEIEVAPVTDAVKAELDRLAGRSVGVTAP